MPLLAYYILPLIFQGFLFLTLIHLIIFGEKSTFIATIHIAILSFIYLTLHLQYLAHSAFIALQFPPIKGYHLIHHCLTDRWVDAQCMCFLRWKLLFTIRLPSLSLSISFLNRIRELFSFYSLRLLNTA